MTTVQAVGAVSREAAEWYAMDWQAIHRNVRRLQVRIVQATKASRWGKVRALQHLLTHSYSGKVSAVRRVTENNGKKTPGVDQEIWDTPEKKNGVNAETILDPSLWPRLAFFASVKPSGDILPVRAMYSETGETNIGLNPLTSTEPIWYAGPDLAASKLARGATPQIVEAFR